MSDLPPLANDAAMPQQGQGALTLNIQYIKDLSFEVPGAPDIFATLREQPRVDLQLDVQARPMNAEGAPGEVFEVALVIRADAQAQGQTCFIAELTFCGVFTLNVDPQLTEAILLVECPRLLFPFARNILADTTRDGGFPPVMLQPIDFMALWQARRGQAGGMGGGIAGTA